MAQYFTEFGNKGSVDGRCNWVGNRLHINHGLGQFSNAIIFDSSNLIPSYSQEIVDENNTIVDFTYYLSLTEKIFVLVGASAYPLFIDDECKYLTYDENSTEITIINNDVFINHGLNGYVFCSAYDENNYLVNFPIQYIDDDNVKVSFPYAPNSLKIVIIKLIGSTYDIDVNSVNSFKYSWNENELTVHHNFNGKAIPCVYVENDLRAFLPTQYIGNFAFKITFPEHDLNKDCHVLIYNIASHIYLTHSFFVCDINTQGDFPTDVSAWIGDDVENTGVVGEWYSEKNITFKWTKSTCTYTYAKYFIAINKDVNYTFDGTEDIIDFISGTNVYEYSTAFHQSGIWYFHVAPFNSSNKQLIGNKASCVYCYNTKPFVPTEMWINSYEFGVNTEIVGLKYLITWQPAIDSDLDYLTYHIQISANTTFNKILYEIPNLDDIGFRLTYDELVKNNHHLLFTNEKELSNVFYLRIRSYDGYQYSNWSLTKIFKVVYDYSDFKCSLLKFKRPEESEDFKNLEAEVFLQPFSGFDCDLRTIIYSYKDINSTVKVLRRGVDDFLRKYSFQCSIGVDTFKDFKCSVELAPHGDLPCIVRVLRYSVGDFDCKIFLVQKTNEDFNCSIVHYAEKTEEDFDCDIRVKKWSTATDGIFNCVIDIWDYHLYEGYSDFNCTIGVRSRTFTYFNASIDVLAIKPNSVLVNCSLPQGVWNRNNMVWFSWLKPYWTIFDVVGYLVAFDMNPNTQIDNSATFHTSLEVWYDFTRFERGGNFYFHIRAVNSVGNMSEITHFEVKYNIVPPVPLYPYLINGIDSLINTPVLSRQTYLSFMWKLVYDANEKDAVTYNLQLSHDTEFNQKIIDVSGIVNNSYFYNVQLSSNTYFWRVRSFDGNEHSDWSPICSFQINTPPPIPEALKVKEY